MKFIRENKKEIESAAKNKNIKIDLDKLLKIDDDKRGLILRINDLRAEHNIKTVLDITGFGYIMER
ncbi:MAG: hypothetical protein AAB653_02505 [Patescibacteria group bacterium]